jgi:hypothetical protein
MGKGEGGFYPERLAFVFFSTSKDRARICKRLKSPGTDSKELIPLAYVSWWASTSNRVVLTARQAGNRLLWAP